MKPALLRELATWACNALEVSQRRVCRLLDFNRSTARYQCVPKDDDDLAVKIRHIAEFEFSYGYRRIHGVLRRNAIIVNHKRVYRLYVENGLAFRRRVSRKLPLEQRKVLPTPKGPNQIWSMDFTLDRIVDGRPVRILAIIDDFHREIVSIECAQAMPSGRLVRALNEAIFLHGKPKRIRSDNGPEFRSKEMKRWAQMQRIEQVFIRPGKPQENGYIESFFGTMRTEFLNSETFLSYKEAKEKLERWISWYNEERLHSSLAYRPPKEYLKAFRVKEDSKNQNKEVTLRVA